MKHDTTFPSDFSAFHFSFPAWCHYLFLIVYHKILTLNLQLTHFLGPFWVISAVKHFPFHVLKMKRGKNSNTEVGNVSARLNAACFLGIPAAVPSKLFSSDVIKHDDSVPLPMSLCSREKITHTVYIFCFHKCWGGKTAYGAHVSRIHFIFCEDKTQTWQTYD